MKKLLVIFLCLLFLPVCAAEIPENGYIARVSEVPSVSSAPEFITIDDLETAELYLEMGVIDYFEINQPVYLYNEVHWQQTAVNLPAAWEKNVSGSGILVGVIDSGVHPHADFGENLVSGYNILTGTTDTTDYIGHGTRVAGRIAAASNGVGTVGAAPAASIMPIKCFDVGVITNTDHIITAIKEGVKRGCRILNMSLGFGTHMQSVLNTVEYALGQGVLLVAATGNNSTSALSYPAAYPGVIGVGAVTETNEKENYSQYNKSVDIVAPGSCVGSTDTNGDYVPDSNPAPGGTSFAAPIISGILALGLECNPSASPEALTEALLWTAHDLGETGRDDYYGYGLADAAAFIENVSQLDTPHLVRTKTGIVLYSPIPVNAQVIFAYYAAENELSSILHAERLSIPAGYSNCIFTIPEGTRVFLWDSLHPFGRKIEI